MPGLNGLANARVSIYNLKIVTVTHDNTPIYQKVIFSRGRIQMPWVE